MSGIFPRNRTLCTRNRVSGTKRMLAYRPLNIYKPGYRRLFGLIIIRIASTADCQIKYTRDLPDEIHIKYI